MVLLKSNDVGVRSVLAVKQIDVYIGRKQIIKQVSFQVKPGEIVGLVGPNGAGKTTIMKTILGLTKFNGKITVNQQAITENHHAPLAKVGALIEHPAIYPFLTGLQNLQLYSQDPTDMRQLVTLLQMDAYINTKAKGYLLGMKQKLGIAIALLNRPDLVILDEPMNGLDVEATISIRKIIKQYAEQGTAFLISSHVLSELQKVMTQVILINHGTMIVNQNVAAFNQRAQNQYQLNTVANAATAKLLQAHQLTFSKTKTGFLVPREEIFAIQDLLAAQQIHLKMLAPVQLNFEQIIVDLLEQQRGREHEKTLS